MNEQRSGPIKKDALIPLTKKVSLASTVPIVKLDSFLILISQDPYFDG
jgi:hypothetical protein